MKKGVSGSRVESSPLEPLAGPLPLPMVSGVGLLVTGPRSKPARQYEEEEEVVRARLPGKRVAQALGGQEACQ